MTYAELRTPAPALRGGEGKGARGHAEKGRGIVPHVKILALDPPTLLPVSVI